MNYNEKHPTISFRVDKKYKIFLDNDAEKQSSAPTQIANNIIKKYYDGDLVDKKSDIVLEMQKLRIEKLKQEIAYLKIKNDFATNFNRPISRSATVHIKPEIIVETPDPYTKNVEPDINWKKAQRELIEVGNKISPYDASNKRLQCVECGCLFGWKNQDEYVEKMGELKNHLLLKHDRPFNALEREVIDNLTYEGDST